MFDNCPPLYQCSVCEKPVKVTVLGEGVEPLKEWECGHTDATIWANRKTTLYGKGDVNVAVKAKRRIKLKMSQLLSWMFQRSI